MIAQAETKTKKTPEQIIQEMVENNFSSQVITETVSPQNTRSLASLAVGDEVVLRNYQGEDVKYKAIAYFEKDGKKAFLLQSGTFQIAIFWNGISWAKKY